MLVKQKHNKRWPETSWIVFHVLKTILKKNLAMISEKKSAISLFTLYIIYVHGDIM